MVALAAIAGKDQGGAGPMDASRIVDGSPCPVGFIGDLADPWVAGIAETLEAGRRVVRMACPGPLPETPFDGSPLPRAVIVHRHRLSAADGHRLESWRTRPGDPAPDWILCNSPYVRYEELERWSSLFDLIVSEAVATEILPGRLARRLDGRVRSGPPPDGPSLRIEVAAGTGDLRRVLVEAFTRAGYTARAVEDEDVGGNTWWERDRRPPPEERVLTIWEVPVLEPAWGRRLEWRSLRIGPTIAMAGFADRSVVTRARQAGAVACLELPCDLDDLIDVVDRTIERTPTASWPIPGRVEPPHRLPPPRRNPRRHRPLVAPSRWPEDGSSPTMGLSGQ
jgi:CheY-like chemotaxis protein